MCGEKAINRIMLHNVDTNALFLDCVNVEQLQSFDQLSEKFNEEWHCTCPYFMQCAKCKHLISFRLNVLKEKVPTECHMGRLLSRKKRGRPKSVPRALEPIVIDENNEEVDDESDDSEFLDGFAPVSI